MPRPPAARTAPRSGWRPAGHARVPRAEGYIIHRDLYDRYLASKAEDHGAEIRTESLALGPIIKNKRVQGIVVHDKNSREKYNLYGKVVVGADGVSSMVGKKSGLRVGLKEDMYPCAESRFTNIEVKDDAIETWLFSKYFCQGWAWVFPKNDHTANIGIGMSPHILRREPLDLQGLLDEFVKKRFYKDQPKEVLRMNGVVPMGKCRDMVAPGLMLVGDAGRVTNPMSGGGIERAIKTGILAGKTISNGDFSLKNLKQYEKRYRFPVGMSMDALLYARRSLSFISDVSPNLISFGADAANLVFGFQHFFMDITGARENAPLTSCGIEGKIAKTIRSFG